MQIIVDLRKDETADLQKAMLLINEALTARGVTVVFDKPAQAALQQSQPVQATQSNNGMPTSTSLFTPRPSPPVAQTAAAPSAPRPAAPSSQDSFNMLNMLGSKGRR